MQKQSCLPVIGIVLVAMALLSDVSTGAIVVWLAGIGVLAFCVGRWFMR